jgi:hypothetical protein
MRSFLAGMSSVSPTLESLNAVSGGARIAGSLDTGNGTEGDGIAALAIRTLDRCWIALAVIVTAQGGQ